jgi:hypothetical protein
MIFGQGFPPSPQPLYAEEQVNNGVARAVVVRFGTLCTVRLPSGRQIPWEST